FGLTAKRETRETDVLRLTVRWRGAPGLKENDPRRLPPYEIGSSSSRPGQFMCRNNPLATLASFLEGALQIPVLDATGLTNNFDIDLKWEEADWRHPNPDGLKQALRAELGLDLEPARQPIEMLVVAKAK